MSIRFDKPHIARTSTPILKFIIAQIKANIRDVLAAYQVLSKMDSPEAPVPNKL